jgi:predicted Zn-dependent protease
MKRPTDAVHYFSEVLKEQPDHFASRLTRAKIYYETENLSAASADLDQLRAGHPLFR